MLEEKQSCDEKFFIKETKKEEGLYFETKDNAGIIFVIITIGKKENWVLKDADINTKDYKKFQNKACHGFWMLDFDSYIAPGKSFKYEVNGNKYETGKILRVSRHPKAEDVLEKKLLEYLELKAKYKEGNKLAICL